MFHLFKKVYLDFDTNIDAYKNRIVISDVSGVEDPGDEGNFYQAQDIADLIGDGQEFATELDLFKKAKELSDDNDDQFIIFCDKPTYQHLFIAWHKNLLSAVDGEALWKVFTFHIDKETYDSAVTGRDEHVQFNDLRIGTWDKTAFLAQFDALTITPDTTFNASILSDLSVDYLLSTDIHSTTSAVRTALKSKIQLLTLRTLQDEVYDIKMYAMIRSQDKAIHDQLGITETPETVADFFAASALSTLTDTTYWNETNKMRASNKQTAVDLTAIPDMTTTVSTLKSLRMAQQGQTAESVFVQKLDWLSWATGTLSDEDYTALLDNEVFTASGFVATPDMHKVNILFIDYILKLYRTSNTANLAKYSIAL